MHGRALPSRALPTDRLHRCQQSDHYRPLSLGVPEDAILIETQATDTATNITNTRTLLAEHGVQVESVTLTSRPYQLRRSWAMFRKLWPEVEIRCASQRMPLADYIAGIGDVRLVVDGIVGDTQRLVELPKFGLAITQDVPTEVTDAYQRLRDAGFTSRLMY